MKSGQEHFSLNQHWILGSSYISALIVHVLFLLFSLFCFLLYSPMFFVCLHVFVVEAAKWKYRNPNISSWMIYLWLTVYQEIRRKGNDLKYQRFHKGVLFTLKKYKSNNNIKELTLNIGSH